MYFLLKYSPFLGGHVSVQRRTCNFPFVDRQPDSHSFLRNLPRSTNPCRGEQYNLGLRPSSERDSAHGSRQKSPRSEEAMVNCGLSLKGYIQTMQRFFRTKIHSKKNEPAKMFAFEIIILQTCSQFYFTPPKFNITPEK